MLELGMEQYGWAIGVGIIIIALSLRKAAPALVRAVADRIAGRTPAPAAGTIASRAPEGLDDLQRRVAELEERVDFAERLLAKQREGERLAKPSS
jgi:hypothetical protein